MNPPSHARYAVYYAPAAEHPLWRAGTAWLGRDASEAQDQRPALPLRTEPWRYGFHATLKAPMRLRPGQDEARLHGALETLAARLPAFEMPRLAVDTLADFIALRPVRALPREHPLWCLADACVCELDPFRAPPSASEQARRLGQPLDAAARLRLQQWGYPHVLEGWRFHMTLSNALPASARAALLEQAQAHFAIALQAQPLRCTDICLFKQPAADAPFLLLRRYRLAGV